MKNAKFIDTNAASGRLGIGIHGVRRLLERRKLNGEVIGRKVLIADDELLKKEVTVRSEARRKLGLAEPEKQATLQDVFNLLKSIDRRLQALEAKK